MTQREWLQRGPGFFPAKFFWLLLLLGALAQMDVRGQSTSETLVSSNSTWRFFRGTNEASTPPTEWRTNTFDDSTWESGPAPFYYFATNALFTNGTLLTDMRSNYTCIFIRKVFVLTNVAQYIALTNRPWADDAYITWLNGVEVNRQGGLGVPGSFQPYNTNAPSGAFFTPPRQINFFTNLLRLGTNIMAAQIFNVSSNDTDFFANPELTAGVVDSLVPLVQSLVPLPGSLNTNLVQITVVFSESVTNVRATNLLINGASATTLLSNSPSSWPFRFPLPVPGVMNVAWQPATTIRDLAGNLFNPTNTWTFTHFIDAPRVLSATPPFGATVSNVLSQITVVFNRNVTGVARDDFVINGDTPISFTGSNTTYTFTINPPPVGVVTVGWDANQVILDESGVRMQEASNTWSYFYVDNTPPTLVTLTPASNSVVAALGQVEVRFSEPVLGVDAGDLLINGVPATSAVGAGAGPYTFQFPAPAGGTVTLAWAVGHNIRDASTNAFAGGTWTVTLNPGPFTGDVIINEFVAANLFTNGVLDIDEFNQPQDWIELFNRGTNNVRLLGWSLSNEREQPGLWTFPDVTITNGQYLVLYASGLDRKVLGGTNRLHTKFKLNPFGKYLALFNAEFPRRATTEFAPEYPEQRNDYSYGRVNSNEWRYFFPPTPGAANGVSTITLVAPKPNVSVKRGYFDQPFNLVATCDLPGAAIRYTTDGSEPTAGTGFAYNAPLWITNSTTLRLAAFASNALPSKAESHSYLFLDSIFKQPANPGTNFPNTFGTQSAVVLPADYEMDPEILTNALYANLVTNALLSLPVISVMIKPSDMWDPITGIYTHTLSRGPDWERPCSLEFFTPDGSEPDFQADGGLQGQGNASREPLKQPKHPLKVQFKGDYGPSNLKYKLFHDSPREEFDSVNLRMDYNFSWLHPDSGQRGRAQRTRDAWMKDSMRAMGGLAGHNRYVHLFINGLYWGVCDPSERPDASFAAAYLGGEKEEFDAINEAHQAVDGTTVAFNQMLALPVAATTAQYDQYKQYLDLPQFIDYMMLHFFVGHEDWGFNKNFYTVRRRVPGAGFFYIPWDGENILGADVNRNDTTRPSGSAATGVPSGLHTKLATNAQYRLDFADRAHRALFNNGALMPTNTVARWMTRASQLDLPIILESARWGDYRRDAHQFQTAPYELYTRNDQWLTEQTRLVGTYLPQRSAIFLAQLRAQFIYPNNTAPSFNQHGGRVPSGFALTMSATNTIYFTTNGTDPRTYGLGTIAPSAVAYTGLVTLGQSMVVKARMLAGTNWSALKEAAFTVGALTPALRVTELMYNPFGGDAFEFIELQNAGPTPLDLGNHTFGGITFTFPFGYTLAAGQRIVLGNGLNTNAFSVGYPGVAVAGWFGGTLANGGETITIFDSFGRTVLSVSYDDENGWPTRADGPGASLELVNLPGDPDDLANWRASAGFGGSPGAANGAALTAAVVLNEIMADNLGAVTNAGTFPDWIELRNTSGSPLALAGWSLTDDGNARKFVFPTTSIPAHGFLVVWADAVTNVTPGIHTGLALGRNGDTVLLYDAATNLVDAISFGPQVANLTIGRIGGAWTLNTPTPNATNAAATIGSASSLSINEWLANSAPGFDDWLELYNSSANPVSLQNTYLGTSNALFQIRSLSYVPAGGFVQFIADERAGADHLDFKLTAGVGAIILYDATGAEVQRVNYGAQSQGVSSGRLPDGTANLVAFPNSLSPAAANYLLNYSGPVLNEVLARNSRAILSPFGSFADYVELFNPTTNAFNLGGFGLSDADDKIKFTFAPGTVLASNAYLVVWCDGGSARTNPPLNSGFSLSGNSGGAYLFSTNGQLVNRVEYGFQATDSPIGLSSGSWQLLAAVTPGSNNAAPAPLGSATNVRINEWMADPGPGQNDWFELHNSDAAPVSLGGLYLTDDFSLAGLSNTPVANLSFIGARDWVKWIADNDPSDGRDHTGFDLDKDTDGIRLYAANFSILDSVSFAAQLEGVSQGRLPDGGTNIVSFPTTPTPEAANYLPLAGLVINEVLTHTDAPLEDAIEIQNTGTNARPIGGWWISNSQRDLKKFRVAMDVTVAPGAFAVIYENQFNADGSGNGTNFTLNSARGDAVYLSEADGAGELTGYRAVVEFGAAENGVSFGRFATSTGVDFTAMAQRTFGSDAPAMLAQFRTGTGLSNGYPKVGPVVISEIMYRPVSGTNAVELANEEFIELQNLTTNAVPLYDPLRPTNGWRLGGGVSFTFNSSVTVGASGFVTVVAFDPVTNAPALAAFRAKYGTNGIVVGPYSGRLDNAGEAIELSKPDAPQAPPHPDAGLVPMILVDRVVYSPTNPWPTSADGGGASLQRVAASLYGNEVLNWIAQAPNAGAANGAGDVVPPTITAQPQSQAVLQGQTAVFSVTGQGTAPLTYQWVRAGTNLPGATNATLTVVNAQGADAGLYRVVINNAASYIFSQGATLTVLVPASIAVPPQSQLAVVGATVQFTVTAGGTAPLHYQWRKEGVNLNGQNAALLTLNNVQLSGAGNYSVLVSNSFGSATSAVAVLTVIVPPAITDDPTNRTVLQNDPVTFFASATGTAPLAYQWHKDGINIPGANSASFSLAAAQVSDEGAYSVVVTNLGGSATSLPAMLTVNTSFVLFAPTVRGDGAFEFRLLGRSNRNYTVEYTTDFSGWTNVTNVTLSSAQATVIDPSASNASSRFYRARLNP